MAFRTVCVVHPRFWAIFDGRCFRLDANRIWLRRKVKASEERNPASILSSSSGLKALTGMGAFMPSFYQFSASLHKSFSEGSAFSDHVPVQIAVPISPAAFWD